MSVRNMGCGASAPKPEVVEPPAKGAGPARTAPSGASASSPAVELVLVLGLEVSGASAVCESLAAAVTAAGRRCVHLELQALIKSEIKRGSVLGGQISTLIQQGKTVPKPVCAQLVRSALTNAQAGVYLLGGYPSSEATLLSMAEEVGHTPKLALLLELPEVTAQERLVASGSDRPAALQKMKSFNMHTHAMIAELERRSILQRIDANESPEAVLAAARAVVDGMTRSGGGGGGGAESAAMAARMVLVLAGPGAGSEEQCARLASRYGCAHLSIESLMRVEVREESETGRAIAKLVRSGKIVPAHLYLSLLRGAMGKQPLAPCLVEGFPKSVDSLQLLEEQMGPCRHALLLDAPDAQLESRLLAPAGETQSSPESVQRRVRTFRNQTTPAITALESRGVLARVDASGKPDAVFAALCAAYERMGLAKP